jgi:hypothetical protein
LQSTTPETVGTLVPKHDPIEVNKYLMSGLVKSEIDSWFEGPPPDERLLEFFRGRMAPLTSTMATVESYIQRPRATVSNEVRNTVECLEYTFNLRKLPSTGNLAFRRSMISLLDSIVVACSAQFQKAALAVTETAICDRTPLMNESKRQVKMSHSTVRDYLHWEPTLEQVNEIFVAYYSP